MIEIKLKTSQNEEIKTLLPNSYNVLTCSQINSLMTADLTNNPKILEILTSVSSELWEQVKFSDMQKIFSELKFLEKPFNYTEYLVNDEIEINSKKIKVPQQIEFETWGQKLFLEDLLKKNQNENLIKIFPNIASVYLTPNYFEKPFKDELCDELTKELMKLPAMYVYPIASFFLLNSINGWKLKIKNYNRNMKQHKFRQELKNFLNSGTLPQSIV